MAYTIKGDNIMAANFPTKGILVEFVRVNFGDEKAKTVLNWDDKSGSFVDPDKMFYITNHLYHDAATIKVNKSISDYEIKDAEKVLIDNGIEADEAEIVLQAIGYVLLDTELYP